MAALGSWCSALYVGNRSSQKAGPSLALLRSARSTPLCIVEFVFAFMFVIVSVYRGCAERAERSEESEAAVCIVEFMIAFISDSCLCTRLDFLNQITEQA